MCECGFQLLFRISFPNDIDNIQRNNAQLSECWHRISFQLTSIEFTVAKIFIIPAEKEMPETMHYCITQSHKIVDWTAKRSNLSRVAANINSQNETILARSTIKPPTRATRKICRSENIFRLDVLN